MTIYESLAEKIEGRIKAGAILAGQKLPSVRELSLKEGVSPSTVVEAYELLMSRGFIESKNRSGFFVSLLSSARLDVTKKAPAFIPNSSVNPDELIKALRLATHDQKIFPFGAASPLPDFYPTKAINKTLIKVLRDEPALMSEYRFAPGLPELRDLIGQRYQKLGVKAPVENIVTTSGAIEAIGLALKSVAKPGDVIGVETPAYFGIIQLVRSLGFKMLEVPLCQDEGLTPEKFEEAIKRCPQLKAMVTIPSFSNPFGTLVPPESRDKIVKIANKHGVVLIEDDIYGELYFHGSRPRPLKAFDKQDNVITVGSFSKTVSPSLRVGYLISGKYASEVMFHRAATTSGLSALDEEVLNVFLDSDAYEKHLRFLRASYKTLCAQYSSAVLNHFPAGTRISQPQGSFVLWIQLPKHIDARDIQRKALAQGISIAPGTIFSPSNKDYVNYMRLNCAIPWGTPSQKAIQKIARMME